MGLDDFRNHLRTFTHTHNVEAHHESILFLLDSLDLDIEYKKLRLEGGMSRILEIFASFSEPLGEDYVNDYDQSSLEQVGELSARYFAEGAYAAFAQMIFELTAESLMEKYGIEKEDESLRVTPELLYQFISEEIYLQTFLLEHMSRPEIFSWQRDERIVEQSLMVLTVCFSDIHSFLVEDEEEEELAD